ncbi:MAG: HNH endonuclease, partial [Rothia mucilaginosa]
MKSFLKGFGVFFAVCFAFSLWYVILGVVIIVVIVGIVLTIRKNRYFASPEFQTHRQRTATLASEYNEIASYVHDIYTHGIYELGTSTNGMYSHLATV